MIATPHGARTRRSVRPRGVAADPSSAARAGDAVVERVVPRGSARDGRRVRGPAARGVCRGPLVVGGNAARAGCRRRSPGDAVGEPAPPATTGRRRILLMTVADHLDRSERVLTEIMNAPAGGDISAEQRWAEDLVVDEPSLSAGCRGRRRTIGRASCSTRSSAACSKSSTRRRARRRPAR